MIEHTRKMTVVLAAFLITGFVAPAAAQNADTGVSTQAEVEADSDMSLTAQVSSLAQAVADLEARIADLEAKINQSSQVEIEKEGSEEDSDDSARAEGVANAQAKANANLDKGVKAGILGKIGSFIEGPELPEPAQENMSDQRDEEEKEDEESEMDEEGEDNSDFGADTAAEARTNGPVDSTAEVEAEAQAGF